MESTRIDVQRQLWRMVRAILKEEGYLKCNSSMVKAADIFEDELYNPPKSESGNSQNDIQQLKAEISKVAKAIRGDSWSSRDVGILNDLARRLEKLSAVE